MNIMNNFHRHLCLPHAILFLTIVVISWLFSSCSKQDVLNTTTWIHYGVPTRYIIFGAQNPKYPQCYKIRYEDTDGEKASAEYTSRHGAISICNSNYFPYAYGVIKGNKLTMYTWSTSDYTGVVFKKM